MKYLGLFFIVTVVAALLVVEPAFAGPGGKIARAAYESFWGKIALFFLAIIFLPLIIMIKIKENKAEKRSRKDLRFMAGYDPVFDWLKIQERATDCFYRVHSSWEKEDLSAVSNWMTDWYWQNQQLAHLNKWKNEGLVNICNVKKILDIKPILFVHRNTRKEHEDSMVVISITAKMNDYLQDRVSNKIVEGSKKFKEIETIWSFTLESGVWKVSNINESSMSLAYAKLIKELPPIESTVVSNLRL